jgi:Na+-translocating ferredoxin:NAD+ oxidoreductase RnfC subunit
MRSRCCVCVSVYPPIVARQQLGRNVTAVTNTHAPIIGRVVFIVARVVSRKVGD